MNCILCSYPKSHAVYLGMSLNNNRKYTSSPLTIRNIKFVSHECPDSHFSSHVYSGAYIHWVAVSFFIFSEMCSSSSAN